MDDFINTKSSQFHSSPEATCASCHSFHSPNLLMAASDTMLLEVAQVAEELCANCHAEDRLPEVSPGHRVAAHLIHSRRSFELIENSSDFCLACHAVEKTIPAELQLATNIPRFHSGGGHTFGVRMIPGYRKPNSTLKIQDEIPPQIPLIDGKIECITCHSLVSPNEFKLAQTIEDGLCVGCHDMGQRFDFAQESITSQ